MTQFRVTVTGAFLRSQPRKAAGNELAVFPEDSLLVQTGPDIGAWKPVTGALAGATFSGFMASRLLAPVAAAPPPPPPPPRPRVAQAHFGENNPAVTRARRAGPAPLGEAGMPRRRAGDGLAVQRLFDFMDWARVDDPAHLRWKPHGPTYCNIYAYDCCYAAGVYLPRVWWKPDAIARQQAGQAVAVSYGNSVREMNANSLHDWLLDWGGDFGWRRATSLDALQDAANRGAVAVICAARKDPNRSGHITMVVAEGRGRAALRQGGQVLQPLQSQAGSTNVRYGTLNRPWWRGAEFRSFVFFFNESASRWT